MRPFVHARCYASLRAPIVRASIVFDVCRAFYGVLSALTYVAYNI